MASFRLICEIEPPTKPDLRHARHQVGVLTPVADRSSTATSRASVGGPVNCRYGR
jgi:hypothetical protein